MMEKAENIAVAMLLIEEDEIFVSGYKSDIQRLYDAGFVERAWDIRLDNGHRPYLAPKKRVCYDSSDAGGAQPQNAVTAGVVAQTGATLVHNLHLLEQTFLFRRTAAFWSDLEVAFAEDDQPPADDLADYYAVYRGCVLPNGNSVKFVRL